MKGLVFKEFMSLVEENYGDETVEKMIESAHLKSKGAYTSVGTYDHGEIISLVSQLSRLTRLPIPQLTKFFGKNLTTVFLKKFPQFFVGKDAFTLLKSIDSIIHVEVKKLYPDAELPKFNYDESIPGALIVDYVSVRPFADLAEGLIEGVIEYYKENIKMQTEDPSGGKNTSRRFILKK